MIRMYSQGVGRFSQGVALGYDLVGLSARFLFVWDDDPGRLSVRCPIDWGDDSVMFQSCLLCPCLAMLCMSIGGVHAG